MNNDYDPVAPFYDRFASLIFGKSQIEAQKWLIHFLEPQSRILIVGGGSGWILEEIAKHYEQGLEIVYVEKSAKMLRLSRQRNCGSNLVKFVHSDVSAFRSEQAFHAVLTGFLFDNFSQQFAEAVFASLSSRLLPGGLWLYTDFEAGNHHSFLHKWMLKAMYWFFGMCCNVETSQLPDMQKSFEQNYQQLDKKMFYSGFICSYAYKKR